MATSREMTSGRPFPLILNFAFPLLLGNLLQQTYSLMDAAIVGKFLGINALASVGASTSVVFLILGFCNGCCGGFGIPVAQKFGARDYGMMRRFVAVSLQLAAVMSVVIAIVTSMFCSDILQMMQTPENILEDAYFYLLITFIGVPCTFFYNLLSSIIRALGDSKTPFWFLLFSTILNICDICCIGILLRFGCDICQCNLFLIAFIISYSQYHVAVAVSFIFTLAIWLRVYYQTIVTFCNFGKYIAQIDINFTGIITFQCQRFTVIGYAAACNKVIFKTCHISSQTVCTG